MLFVLQTQTTSGAHPSHHGVKVGSSTSWSSAFALHTEQADPVSCRRACRLETKLIIIIGSHIFLNSCVLIFVQCSVLGFKFSF